MKTSTQDKVAGTTKNVTGKVKESVANQTGDRDLRAEGRRDQVEGKVQKKIGDIKKVFGK